MPGNSSFSMFVSSSGNASSGNSTNGFSDCSSLFCFLSVNMDALIDRCTIYSNSNLLLAVKLLILLTGLTANVGLAWLLLNRRRSLSASEVLGFNLSLLDILYCLCLPLDVYIILHPDAALKILMLSDAVSALNVFGCPLLLAFMCVERYVAVAHPVAYVRLRRREYRCGVCVLVWLLTLIVALLGYYLGIFNMILHLAVITSVLFLVMLLCLLGMVWVLWGKGPGEGQQDSVPLKRKVLRTILAVMLPAVVAYTPLLALVPLLSIIYSQRRIETNQCSLLQFLWMFPCFGTYIGPMFYLARIRQLAFWRKVARGVTEQAPNSNTQVGRSVSVVNETCG